MKKEHRLAGALCANALIVILELIALGLSIIGQGPESFLFYTQDSNYLTMAVSMLFCIFVLMPAMGENAFSMLYEGSMLYQHTLCPILAVFSFFVFEIENELPKTDMIKALIPTLAYALIAIALNICRVIEGPYPFLMVYSQPWYVSVLWCIIILGIAGLLAFAVWELQSVIRKRRSGMAMSSRMS